MRRFKISDVHSNNPGMRILPFCLLRAKRSSRMQAENVCLCILKLPDEAGFSPGSQARGQGQVHRPSPRVYGGARTGGCMQPPLHVCSPPPHHPLDPTSGQVCSSKAHRLFQTRNESFNFAQGQGALLQQGRPSGK